MAMPDPFTESEKAQLLKEIISTSNVPSQTLANIIYDLQLIPSWEDTRLPPGRTMRQCQAEFHDIMLRFSPHPMGDPRAPASHLNPPRPSMPPDASFSGGRNIQPRPPHMGPFAPESPMSAFSPTTSETQGKRRGRPNRAEAERRKRRKEEAAARGEKDPYPSRPRKKPKTEQPPPPPEIEVSTQPPSAAFTAAAPSASSAASLLGFTNLPPPRTLPPSSSSLGPTLAPILSTTPPDVGSTYGRERSERSAPSSRPPPPSAFPMSVPPGRPPTLAQLEPYPPPAYPPEAHVQRSTRSPPRHEHQERNGGPPRLLSESSQPPAATLGESMEH